MMMHQEEEPERMDNTPTDYGTAPLLGGEAVKQALDGNSGKSEEFEYVGTASSSDDQVRYNLYRGRRVDDLPHMGAGNTPQRKESAIERVVKETIAAFDGKGIFDVVYTAESTSECQHRSRLIRSGMELCDDGCGAVLGDGVTLAPIIDSEPSGNTGELDSLSRSGKGDLFRRIAKEIGDLVASKNEAYGSSFSKTGDFLRLLYPEQITPDQYDDALLMVRMFDKQMRIANKKDAFGENPYRDISGYGICGAAMSNDDDR